MSNVAQAQDDPTAEQDALERQSRIHPSSALRDQPPPVNTSNLAASAINMPKSPDKVEPPVKTDVLVGVVELCMNVVSPQLDVKPHILTDNGWGYGQLEQGQRGPLRYESVNYYKRDLQISLQDFEKFVDCRAVARVEGEQQISDMRSALVKNLKATPIKDTVGMEQYVARTEQAAPQTNFENLLIVGDYLVEFWRQPMDMTGLDVDGPPSIELALLSVTPLPEKFQARNRTAAAH